MLINIYLISRWGEPAEHKEMKPELEQDLVIISSDCGLLRKADLRWVDGRCLQAGSSTQKFQNNTDTTLKVSIIEQGNAQ